MIYFFVLFLLFVCIYVYDYRRYNIGSLVAYFTIALLLIGIAGLRYRLGIDSTTYEAQYKSMPSFEALANYDYATTRYEPGFIVFVGIAKAISPDFTYFQILHAIFVNSIIFWFVYKNTENKFIGITLYYICLYLNLNMEVLRESLAVCAFLLAWPFFRDGKWIFYYLFAILACFFHASATVTLFLPICLLPGIRKFFRLGYRTFFICIGLFVIAFILQKKVFLLVEASGLNQSLADKAQLYSKSHFGGMNLNIIGMTDVVLRNIFFPWVAIWYLRNRIKILGDKFDLNWLRKIETLVTMGIYFAVVTLVIFIFNRFNNYFGMFSYVAIASCFFTKLELPKKRVKISGATWSAILFVILFLNFRGYLAGTYGSSARKTYTIYYPYTSRLNPVDDPDREMIYRYAKKL